MVSRIFDISSTWKIISITKTLDIEFNPLTRFIMGIKFYPFIELGVIIFQLLIFNYIWNRTNYKIMWVIVFGYFILGGLFNTFALLNWFGFRFQ